MSMQAAVITISDKGAAGTRTDTAGPAVCALLQAQGYEIVHTAILPDDGRRIQEALITCCDDKHIPLVVTVGGTGFSPRDVTPEATRAVIEREVPGIPEVMRAESMKITPNGCLSRAVCGIRGKSLILNLPGSQKAATENLSAVIAPLAHGLNMLLGAGSADCGAKTAIVRAVCISEKKGEQKHAVEEVQLRVNHGIVGDAHAGNWHRQISLLGIESVRVLQEKINFPLEAGAFAENILTEGMVLYQLPVGTKLKIGTALCEVTQIGKECHSDCAIRQKAGDCVMPREGIFVKVLEDGVVKAGDTVMML